MTTSQREILNVVNNHADKITQIMKFCESNNIKFAHHEPLKYAVIKMHGMIDTAKSLGLPTGSYRWAYAVVPEITNFFVAPVKENQEQQRPRIQSRNKQKEFSAKPV